MEAKRVLAADLGGTKTLFCIAECKAGGARIVRQERFECAAFAGFAEMLREFLAAEGAHDFAAVCLGIAGPVQETAAGQYVKVTNLPWDVRSEALTHEFGFKRVRLMNDFAAVGFGIDALGDGDLVPLHARPPVAQGPRAVIGAGTGLGQALLVWNADHYQVIATEGSKVDFGPTDELQMEFARYLMQRHQRASYELILTGSGLVRIYEFLRARQLAAESPTVTEAMLQNDPAAVIAHAALELGDPLANAALDLFVSIYGAQAGNLALATGAVGGVYLAGGIAPKIVSRLHSGPFIRAFTHKGKMSAYVDAIPVHVVLNPEVGLLGAVAVARRMLG